MRTSGRSTALWLAWGYLALIVYASLYPFGPWEWPVGMPFERLLQLPWPRYWIRFDVLANALGYVPFGLLVFTTLWRHGHAQGRALLLALLLPSLLAYALEVLQFFVATRVPSLGDWVLNSGGAVLGVLMGWLLVRSGFFGSGMRWRERCFLPHSAAGLALLALWPLGLLFPAPLPLAEGQFLPATLHQFAQWLEGGPWADSLPVLVGHRPGAELASTITALGLIVPALLMLALTRQGWHRLILLLGLLAVGVGMTSLSAALGFGPQHAWSWPTPQTGPAFGVGLLLVLPLALLPARVNALLALPALTALIVLVNGIAPDAYWQQSLIGWESGRRVQLFGLAQWLGWWWPLLTLGWLIARLASRDEGYP